MDRYISELKKRYGTDIPFTLDELSGKSSTSIQKALSNAVRKKELASAAQGVYYFPHRTFWGTYSVLSARDIAYKLYMEHYNGFYSGLSFENNMGLLSQVPSITEITTNNTNMQERTVYINNQVYLIKQSRVSLTKENIDYIMWLDYVTDTRETYLKKNTALVKEYLKNKECIKMFLPAYPLKTFKRLVDCRIL